MHLKRVLSIHVAVLAFLASLLLGLGQREPFLPMWTLLGGVGAIWLTDVLGWVRLNHRWANLLIIVIIVFSLGDLVRSQGAGLAMAIARVLVFVQIVLLFRDKDRRCYWHLLALSLLEVVVATSFEQDAVFGLLLLVFALVGVSSMSILFLHSEASYFDRNAESPAHHGLRTSLDLRAQNWMRILKISVATFVIGPASLLLQQRTQDDRADGEPDTTRGKWMAWRKPQKVTAGRWPLAHAEAVFSSTAASSGLSGVNFSFYRLIASMTVKAVVVAVIIFWITPRARHITIGPLHFQHAGWGASHKSATRSVGFSDNIQLGSLDTALKNSESVLRIALRDEATGEEYRVTSDLYLQGTALTSYNEGHWSYASDDEWQWGDAARGFVRSMTSNRQGRAMHERRRAALIRAAGADRVLQDIIIEPMDNDALFCVWPYYELSFENQYHREGDARVHRPNASRRTRALLGTAGFADGQQLDLTPCQSYVDPIALSNLPDKRLPELVALADRWIGESGIPADDPIGRARYLEARLAGSGEFRYSLEGQSRDPNSDPIEDFISRNREGHCEFFATALALMLRSQGIPSRVLVGFRTGMYNSLGKFYQFRQLDAHSWVQAYIAPRYLDTETPGWERGAWLRLDATPAADPTVLGDLADNFDSWHGWLSYAWESYIMQMDDSRQRRTFFAPLRQFLGEMKAAFHVDWWSTQWSRLRNSIHETIEAWRKGEWFNGRGGLIAVVLSVLVYGLYRLIRFISGRLWAWRREAATGAAAGRAIRVEFYKRLEAILSRYDLQRRAGQTQREFALAFAEHVTGGNGTFSPEAAAALAPLPESVVTAFYRVRFGGEAISRSDMKLVEKALRDLQRHEPNTKR